MSGLEDLNRLHETAHRVRQAERAARETGTCRFCGKEIRLGREGFFGATAQDDGALWYCEDDPSDERRHEPA